MKLIIDARFTRTTHHDGISRFTSCLIEESAKRADVTMLINDPAQLPLLPDVPYVLINSPLSPFEPFVAYKVNKLKPDVVFSPMQTMGSMGRNYGLILTLHDLIYYEHPKAPGFLPLPVRLGWFLFHQMYWPQRMLLNRPDAVATVSETTRGLIKKHKLSRKRVELVSNAPAPGAIPRDPGKIPDKTLLYMGSFMPYKNVETLICAMGQLPDFSLHLLSNIAPHREAELRALIQPGSTVVFHHGVSDAEYQDLLKTTTALVSLSKAEGYGLPLVEAMNVGTPVIATDMPIFREVGSDAISYVDPEDPDKFVRAVRELTDPHVWTAASKAGVERAGFYTWGKSAGQLIELAQAVVDQRKKR
ncbi:mannosyltransferase [Arthrobacter sp. MYb227]|uniref:glycosyltransferase family 4 protein n=1 Tax=Arthrobacter sp. MYb227 TaxID=1848601 RepID=UPI000CFBB9EE|nr:glycosyltransferase family 1 protein [Arthrobacter sp. MYb227]PQZ92980.1 mannosyltransferase [Arthrobacter sp. MYb227]